MLFRSLVDHAAAFAVGDQDGARIAPVGGFEEAMAQRRGNILDGAVGTFCAARAELSRENRREAPKPMASTKSSKKINRKRDFIRF